MSRRKHPTGDYEVGYKRPPVATRFQPGQCGNPHPRRKRPKTVGEQLHAALMTKCKVVENGREKTYTAQEVIIRNLVGEATRKNLRAVMAVFALSARYGASDETVLNPADLPADDRAIIEGFLNQALEGRALDAAADGTTGSDTSHEGRDGGGRDG